MALDRDPKSDRIVRCVSEILFRPEIPFGGLDGRVAQQQLNLFKLAARQSLAQVRRKSWGAMPGTPTSAAYR